ncbi:hypothetical protein QFZ42_003298 [Variovorax paradoxus]|uniref:hypothetical protein n=1 Tax=Variovorax paradoxus TaxID=34073 RepID=UPI002794A059|nr:hypothetical protein [Variovorax paradoxus]MDQ0571464.1 hypothetical protein [Variovorax paradoxus]
MTIKTLALTLDFHAVGATPPKGDGFDSFLLYNQCDGFHTVFARWDDDGVFEGFFDFLGRNEYKDDFYEAWARLPDCNAVLFPVFGCSPSRAALALDAMVSATIDKAKTPPSPQSDGV